MRHHGRTKVFKSVFHAFEKIMFNENDTTIFEDKDINDKFGKFWELFYDNFCVNSFFEEI